MITQSDIQFTSNYSARINVICITSSLYLYYVLIAICSSNVGCCKMFAVTCLLVSHRHTQRYAGTAELVTGRQTDPSKQGVEHVTVQCITFRKYIPTHTGKGFRQDLSTMCFIISMPQCADRNSLTSYMDLGRVSSPLCV